MKAYLFLNFALELNFQVANLSSLMRDLITTELMSLCFFFQEKETLVSHLNQNQFSLTFKSETPGQKELLAFIKSLQIESNIETFEDIKTQSYQSHSQN